MKSVVPYLIRAYCDWIEDSALTPHILVDCEKNGVVVPNGFTKEEKIVLNKRYDPVFKVSKLLKKYVNKSITRGF